MASSSSSVVASQEKPLLGISSSQMLIMSSIPIIGEMVRTGLKIPVETVQEILREIVPILKCIREVQIIPGVGPTPDTAKSPVEITINQALASRAVVERCLELEKYVYQRFPLENGDKQEARNAAALREMVKLQSQDALDAHGLKMDSLNTQALDVIAQHVSSYWSQTFTTLVSNSIEIISHAVTGREVVLPDDVVAFFAQLNSGGKKTQSTAFLDEIDDFADDSPIGWRKVPEPLKQTISARFGADSGPPAKRHASDGNCVIFNEARTPPVPSSSSSSSSSSCITDGKEMCTKIAKRHAIEATYIIKPLSYIHVETSPHLRCELGIVGSKTPHELRTELMAVEKTSGRKIKWSACKSYVCDFCLGENWPVQQ